MKFVMYRTTWMLVIVGLTLATPAHAIEWSAADIAAMPAYCAGRLAWPTNPAEYKRWEDRYGPDFLHTHHLCYAIGLLNKYPGVLDQTKKRTMIRDIIDHLKYVTVHVKPNFKLMPEVYYYRALAYQLDKRPGEAISDLRKAIDLDPTYVKGYMLLADYLLKLGQREDAVQVVMQGLHHLPDAPSLLSLYTKLGGEPKRLQTTNKSSSDDNPSPALPHKQEEPRIKRVLFDFGQPMSAVGNAFREAGKYVFVEFKQSSADAKNKIIMTVSSHAPQPAMRVVRIGVDPGVYRNMLASIRVIDKEQAKYWPVTEGAQTAGHALWPGFRPFYSIEFTVPRNEKSKLYDRIALPPGSGLVMELTLAPGYGFEDVVDAVKKGLRHADGMRIAIIAHHTKGYRPDPRVTIMDDGGFVTANLLEQSGLNDASSATESYGSTQMDPVQSHVAANEGKLDAEPSPATPSSGPEVPEKAAHTPAALPAKPAPVIGTPRNPWCRFCPVGTQ